MKEYEIKHIDTLIEESPDNFVIFDMWTKLKAVIDQYEKVSVAISGGSDSDILVDFFCRTKYKDKIQFVFFDTGLEYQATKDHLRYLEEKYDINIFTEKAVKPIPISIRQHGSPFLSKYASHMISRLQSHNFDFVNDINKTFNELYPKYPNCKVALSWLTTSSRSVLQKKSIVNGKVKWTKCELEKDPRDTVEHIYYYTNIKMEEYVAMGGYRITKSSFNITRNKYLKEFMSVNPPTFAISDECCKYSKKNPAAKFIKEKGCDLSVIGVRKSEDGIRTSAYKDCFDFDRKKIRKNSKGEDVVKKLVDNYRPLFFMESKDKLEYEKYYGITHSLCYSEYGLKRTGCAGCSYGKDFENELKVIEKYEPKLFKAVNKIFGDTYEYTRQYYKFRKEKENNENK